MTNLHNTGFCQNPDRPSKTLNENGVPINRTGPEPGMVKGPYNAVDQLKSRKLQNKMLNRIRLNGGIQREACNRHNVKLRSWYRFCKNNPSFREKVYDAVKTGAELHKNIVEEGTRYGERKLIKLLEQVDLDPNEMKPKEVIEVMKYLQKSQQDFHKNFGDTYVQQNLHIENLNPQELQQLLSLHETMSQKQIEAK